MSAAATYAERLIPEPYTILGLRLKPLSLQHYLLMSRFGVAFVAEGEEGATLADLLTGVLICSRHWKEGEFEEFVSSGDFEKEISQWGELVGMFDLNEKAKLFADYIREGSEIPHYWEEDAGRPSGAHWTQCVLLVATGQLGYSRREALRAPLKTVLADYFKHAENQGLIRLMTESEWAIVKQAEDALKGGEQCQR